MWGLKGARMYGRSGWAGARIVMLDRGSSVGSWVGVGIGVLDSFSGCKLQSEMH